MKKIVVISLIAIITTLLLLFTKQKAQTNQEQDTLIEDVYLKGKDVFIDDFQSFMNDDDMIHATISFMLFDAESNESVFEYNADKAVVPASVVKIFSTATALEMLGPKTVFSTSFGYEGVIDSSIKYLKGNLIIRGGGDPSLGSKTYPTFYDRPSFIVRWAEEFRKLGIDSISGNIIADDAIFDSDNIPDDWAWIDIPAYYGTAPFGISIYENTYKVLLNTQSRGIFKPGKDSLEPNIPMLSFENHISNQIGMPSFLDLHGSYYNWHRIIKGNLPKAERVIEIRGSIPDPPYLLAFLLHNELKKNGIVIKGEPLTVRTMKAEKLKIPDDFKIIAHINSPPLTEIVRRTNMVSQNLYAEHILIHCGLKNQGRGNTKAGIHALNMFWMSKKLDLKGMVLTDGSGISRSNAASARHLVDVLAYMLTQSENNEAFYMSLPVSGESGTMKNFAKESVLKGKLRAKSGSMARVRSYAGYTFNKDGKEYVFAIIVNNFSGKPVELRAKLEKILISAYNNL